MNRACKQFLTVLMFAFHYNGLGARLNLLLYSNKRFKRQSKFTAVSDHQQSNRLKSSISQMKNGPVTAP